jgi:hypothetical protein
MKINSSEFYPASSVYFERGFRIVLDDHVGFLKDHNETTVIAVKPLEALKYEGDFSGLLTYYNIPINLHWVTMRMNGLTTPADSPAEITSLIVPSEAVVERLRSGYMAENKIRA